MTQIESQPLFQTLFSLFSCEDHTLRLGTSSPQRLSLTCLACFQHLAIPRYTLMVILALLMSNAIVTLSRDSSERRVPLLDSYMENTRLYQYVISSVFLDLLCMKCLESEIHIPPANMLYGIISWVLTIYTG